MRPNLRHTARILKNRLIHRQSRSYSDLTDSKPRAFGKTGEALFKDTAWEGLSLKSLLKDGCPSLRLSLLRLLKMRPVARDLADQLVVDVVAPAESGTEKQSKRGVCTSLIPTTIVSLGCYTHELSTGTNFKGFSRDQKSAKN